MSTVELDFKNRQDKNQLGFKNQIANDQVDQISFKDRQDKNNLTLRTKMAVTKNVLKVKFDCTRVNLIELLLKAYANMHFEFWAGSLAAAALMRNRQSGNSAIVANS